MPRKYVPKTKKFRKRPRYNNSKRNNLLYKAPMPNKFATKLRYVGQANLNPTTGGLAAAHIINAIGCYQPDITGGGHQPRGFDQIMAMYDHYQVIGAKITVQFMQAYGSTYNPIYIGIALKDDLTPYVDPNDYLEGRNLVSTVMPAHYVNNPATSRSLSKTFSLRKFLSVTKAMSSNQYRGTSSSNPNDSAYFHIFAAPVNSSADEPALVINFRIDYIVVFTEPRQPSQS